MGFVIYPAIDLRGGRCVRLHQGDYGQETVYGDNPVDVALAWQAQGAEWIHVVDLDGAKAGAPVQADLVAAIARAVDVPVQVGGGLRTRADVERLFACGAERVILGTAAIENRRFVCEVLAAYGEKVAIGIDARDGFVATRGWLETSQVRAEDLAHMLADEGATTFIFTDISRDGTLSGPNVEAIVRLAVSSGQHVIASGGVSQLSDVHELARWREKGVAGAIVGKALYTGGVDLSAAIAATRVAEG